MVTTTERTKRGRGRPPINRDREKLAGWVDNEVALAFHWLAQVRRRSLSSEVAVAVESAVLEAEAELRHVGKWTPALERLKKERGKR